MSPGVHISNQQLVLPGSASTQGLTWDISWFAFLLHHFQIVQHQLHIHFQFTLHPIGSSPSYPELFEYQLIGV